jgi:4-aminobutyrate aminotransferase
MELQKQEQIGNLLPRIVVEPPGPNSRNIAGILGEFETPTLSAIQLGEIPTAWKQARGANILDVDGNLYVDMTAGFCVGIVGHCHPRVVEAIKMQAEIMTHAPAAQAPCPTRAELVRRIGQIVPRPLKRTHLLTGGAEAIDVGLKLARLHTKRMETMAFEGGFHGKTLFALSATSRRHYRSGFLPLVPGVFHAPFPYCYRCPFGEKVSCGDCSTQCLNYIEHMIKDPASGITEVAAMLLEPVEGHEGWIVPPDDFLPGLREICNENGILLMLDEIITGFGRTGKMFCFQHYGTTPDILVCAKGVASGFPISLVVSTDAIMGSWGAFKHTSTFSANPLGCAAALASIDVIEKEKLIDRSAKMGQQFMKRLEEMKEKHRIVGDARGIGMMCGLELVSDAKKTPAVEETKRAVEYALKRGVILQPPGGRFGNVLKLSPPLVITEEQLDFGLRTIDDALAFVEKH